MQTSNEVLPSLADVKMLMDIDGSPYHTSTIAASLQDRVIEQYPELSILFTRLTRATLLANINYYSKSSALHSYRKTLKNVMYLPEDDLNSCILDFMNSRYNSIAFACIIILCAPRIEMEVYKEICKRHPRLISVIPFCFMIKLREADIISAEILDAELSRAPTGDDIATHYEWMLAGKELIIQWNGVTTFDLPPPRFQTFKIMTLYWVVIPEWKDFSVSDIDWYKCFIEYYKNFPASIKENYDVARLAVDFSKENARYIPNSKLRQRVCYDINTARGHITPFKETPHEYLTIEICRAAIDKEPHLSFLVPPEILREIYSHLLNHSIEGSAASP
jgi:hypothetical protein